MDEFRRPGVRGWWEQFSSSARFDFLALFCAVILALLLVAAVWWALSQTNDPDYDPPRNAYFLGGVR